MSSFTPGGATLQADHSPFPSLPITLSWSTTVRTSNVTSGLPAGSVIGTCPPAAARSPSGSLTPSRRIPCTRRPGGIVSDRLIRP